MRCLVTGSTGFVGSYLISTLQNQGYEVFGTGRREMVCHYPYKSAELTKYEEFKALLEWSRPEWIFHVAGQPNPAVSFRDPHATWATNFNATQILFDLVWELKLSCRILYLSTGLVYGDANNTGLPFDESDPLKPASPYASSKAAAEMLAYQSTRFPGLDVVRVRPFNQIGPNQSTDYAIPNFARQIAAIKKGAQPPILRTGNLNSIRDFTDVRDMCEAYIKLLKFGKTGEVYNAASGQTYLMRDILHRLIDMAQIQVEIVEMMDPSRRNDVALSSGSIRKISETTGWIPQIPIDQTLSDILKSW